MPVITNRIRYPDQLPRMAKALNVDLAQTVLDCNFDLLRRHDMAFKCSECPEKSACEDWLNAHREGTAEAPDYCLNKILLEELRR